MLAYGKEDTHWFVTQSCILILNPLDFCPKDVHSIQPIATKKGGFHRTCSIHICDFVNVSVTLLHPVFNTNALGGNTVPNGTIEHILVMPYLLFFDVKRGSISYPEQSDVVEVSPQGGF